MVCLHRVNEWAGVTASNIDEQTSCPLDGARLTLKVDAPLEAMTGIGVQTVLPGSTGDRFWRKKGCFKENIASGRFHSGRQTAHNAGHANGAARISDE